MPPFPPKVEIRPVQSPNYREGSMSGYSGFQVGDSAPSHYQKVARPFMQPFADALAAVAVRQGDAVLDVACGTGIATRAAASLADLNGRVVGTDINAAMLGLAEAISVESEDGISWDEASALDLPYADGSFDRVLSQQGVQFFPDPAAGLREMARVTRAEGTVAVTVWSALRDSPYFEGMYHMLLRYCDVQPVEMAWSATPDQIEGWFKGAGLRPEVRQIVRPVSLPPPLEYIPAHMAATPWASAFDSLSSEKKATAVEYMAGYVEHFLTESGVDVPFSSHLATASV